MNDFEETVAPESEPPSATAFTEWNVILAELSSGLEQLLYQDVGDRGGIIYPDHLRLGLSRLSAAMIRAGAVPPHSIHDVIDLMQQPVRNWRVCPVPPEHMKALTLLDGEDITDDAESCIDSNPDVAGEWTQRIMKEVVDNCRSRDDQEGYVTFRRCIVERPVATRQELIEVRRKLPDGDLQAKLAEAYEEVPKSSVSGDLVRTCERCGWSLLKEVNRDVWRCAFGRCRQLKGIMPRQFPDNRPFIPGTQRVRQGLARYTTRPGGFEMRLYRALEALGELTVELWPHCDAYDLGITFPNSEKWAIDCKDAMDPTWLAGNLNKGQFSTLGSWHRAFYVFPGYLRTLNREYGGIFNSRWQRPSANVEWGFEDEFLKRVRVHVD